MTLDAKAVAFGAYFLVILAIGVWATRFSSRGVSEYFIGGRSVPRFVVALSAVVWCAILVGISGQAVFRGETALATKQASETVLLQLTQTYLPPLVAGFVLAALFAAIMSTADSQLLVVASSIVRDLVQRVVFKGTELSQRVLVLLSRLVVLGVAVGAVAVAWRGAESLHALIVLAWSGVGGSLGPPLILCVFWRRLTTAGAIAGILTGTVTVLYWGTNPSLTSITSEIVPGFGASLFATILFSLLTKPPADADESLAIMGGRDLVPR